jgi:dTMP kinase
VFVTFEGIDGCGKTTQLRLLQAALEERGLDVVVTREPGGTGLAESIRHTLLHATGEIAARSELLLFGAARAQHVKEIIRPALERGAWVLSDRFGDSSVAYQGGGLGLDKEFIRAMNAFATGDLQPDVTFYLDLESDAAFQRRRGEGEDKIEARGLEFQDRVRAAYLEIAAREPERVRVLDGRLTPEEIHQAILLLVK